MFIYAFVRVSAFQCFSVSVFQCFGVSVFQSFSVSVFQCFGIPPILPQPCRTWMFVGRLVVHTNFTHPDELAGGVLSCGSGVTSLALILRKNSACMTIFDFKVHDDSRTMISDGMVAIDLWIFAIGSGNHLQQRVAPWQNCHFMITTWSSLWIADKASVKYMWPITRFSFLSSSWFLSITSHGLKIQTKDALSWDAFHWISVSGADCSTWSCMHFVQSFTWANCNVDCCSPTQTFENKWKASYSRTGFSFVHGSFCTHSTKYILFVIDWPIRSLSTDAEGTRAILFAPRDHCFLSVLESMKFNRHNLVQVEETCVHFIQYHTRVALTTTQVPRNVDCCSMPSRVRASCFSLSYFRCMSTYQHLHISRQ